MLDIEEEYSQDNAALPVQMFASVAEFDSIPIWGYNEEFFDRVEDRGYDGLDLKRKQYDRANHDDTWIPAYRDALEFLYGL